MTIRNDLGGVSVPFYTLSKVSRSYLQQVDTISVLPNVPGAFVRKCIFRFPTNMNIILLKEVVHRNSLKVNQKYTTATR